MSTLRGLTRSQPVECGFIQPQGQCGYVLRELIRRRATNHGKKIKRVAQNVCERNLCDGDVMPARKRPCPLEPSDVVACAEIGCTPTAHVVAVRILRIVVF